MTHTLHPEIEALEIELLRKFNKDPQDDRTIREILEKYLKMPQPIENEPLPEKEKLLGVDHPTNGDRGCKIYGYVENGITNITRVEYVDLPKEELKQSTPQIEKIDMDKLSMMLYAGSDSEGNSWSSDIPGAIKMLADYINNTLPTKL